MIVGQEALGKYIQGFLCANSLTGILPPYEELRQYRPEIRQRLLEGAVNVLGVEPIVEGEYERIRLERLKQRRV